MTDRRRFLETSLVGIPLLTTVLRVSQPWAGETFTKPWVVSTWDSGVRANAAAWPVLRNGGRAIDAVEAAARSAEDEPSCCVGLAALPDRDGYVTLDASIMDGNGNVGAVSFLENIKHPITVARKLMETTPHVMLSGEGARKFAVENGFPVEKTSLSAESEKAWREWLRKSEYKPKANIENQKPRRPLSQFAPNFFEDGSANHDTMGTIAMDSTGGLAGAVTTSGMAYKIRGRVGDSPIIGAGLFVDNEVGAATSSGVGEEVIRICGTHTVIEQMRLGKSPEDACREAIRRVVKRDPARARTLQVGFVALARSGEIGAFSVVAGFSYSVTNDQYPTGKVFASKSHFENSK